MNLLDNDVDEKGLKKFKKNSIFAFNFINHEKIIYGVK